MDKIKKAKKRYRKACEELTRVVAEAYPVGARLTVKLGKYVIDVEVTDHAPCWWSNPDEPDRIAGTNLKTGKKRYFYPGNIIKGGR